MDDFLKKLYDEEMDKTASTNQRAFFDALPASDLESYLGLQKEAVGGPIEPALSPAMKKSIEAREAKAKDAEKRVAQSYSKSETQPERNIAPLTPGQEVPERNFVQPGRSIPENTLAVKQASVQWADQMGRSLAHAAVEGRLPFDVEKVAACAIGKESDFTSPEAQAKAKVMARALKATKGAPPKVRKAAVKVTAQQMRKEAAEKYLKK